MKIKLIYCFILVTSSVFSQKLIYIPDSNLRKELSIQGYTTSDSLDTKKTVGVLQLNLVNKNIQSLDGLQYFPRVWNLNVSINKLENLYFLPPNLRNLKCARNNLTSINEITEGLTYLDCSGNKISTMKNIPESLTYIIFCNNQMEKLPTLSKNIQYINYFNNPIPKEYLPSLYKKVECTRCLQNCIPNELIDWNILNNNIKSEIKKIKKLEVTVNSNYSWGMGSKSETIVYKSKCNKLHSDFITVKKTAGPRSKEEFGHITEQTISHKNDIKKEEIKIILNNMYNQVLKIPFTLKDTNVVINLMDKKNGGPLVSNSCSDCTFYGLKYTFYTENDTIVFRHSFNDGNTSGADICFYNNCRENLSLIANWLYLYKFVNLTHPQHFLTDNFFNTRNLKKVIDWDKKYSN